MAAYIQMPAVSANATTAVLQAWCKKPGDTFRKGDCIAEVETEKAMVEINAEGDGVLSAIYVEAGQEVEVGTALGLILAPGEPAPKDPAHQIATRSAGPSESGSHVSDPKPHRKENAQKRAKDITSTSTTDRPRASPLARRLASENGLSLAGLKGSGPNGRIVRYDVTTALTATPLSQPAPQKMAVDSTRRPTPITQQLSEDYEEIAHSPMRRAIARRLSESKSSVPHFYLTTECRVDALLKLREEINVTATHRVSINDLIVKACAAALLDVPGMNSIWAGDVVRRFSRSDIAVAVSTHDGLLTPVVRDVGSKGLGQVSAEIAEMAGRARDRRLRPEELEGGSFCVSNLGMKGVEGFTAIINPPQSGILAVGTVRRVPIVEGDQVSIGQVIRFTLSVDHRCIDGAVAADWLASFVSRLSNPMRILL